MPTAVLTHEMGIIDLDLEITMERVILTVKVMRMSKERVVKRLFMEMFQKRIPGFCTTLKESLKELEIESIEDIVMEQDKRKCLKKKLQNKRLIGRMMRLSKTDGMLVNYDFDGKMKDYLLW